MGWHTYRKAAHVGEEDVNLDHLGDGGAGLGQHGLQVLDAGSRLVLDASLNEIPLLVARDLAGAVDGRGRLDGLGLRLRVSPPLNQLELKRWYLHRVRRLANIISISIPRPTRAGQGSKRVAYAGLLRW